MKTNISNKFLLLVFGIGLLFTGFTACDDSNDWSVDDSHNRLFHPTTLETTVDGVNVSVKWRKMPQTNDYVLEFSEDSLLFNQIVNTATVSQPASSSDGTITALFKGLKANTQYSVRIKSTSDAGIPESKWIASAFRTKTEQIMYAVDPDNVKPTTVLLKWVVPNDVTHFIISASGASNIKADISASEAVAGEKTITGLTPELVYTATLYNGTAIRGVQTFTTPAYIPDGPKVIVLSTTEDNLAAVLATAPSGSTIVLLKNTKYNLDTEVLLPSEIEFWGQGQGSNKPKICMNGFKLPTEASVIKFTNIDITGYQNDDQKTKRNYIFNQSSATNTDQIIFESCIIRNLVNTPFRVQGSSSILINKLVFNNCTAYDCGNNNVNGTYAFINNNVATSKINNIEITNSTLYTIGYGLILHNASPSQSIRIENCTFNNSVGDGRYFIDYNAQSAGTFTIKNVIIGKTLSPANTARGIRCATAPTVINSYQTSDCNFTSNAIPGINVYTKSSTDIFADPNDGIFTIKDASFPGKSDSGDPRWRQ